MKSRIRTLHLFAVAAVTGCSLQLPNLTTTQAGDDAGSGTTTVGSTPDAAPSADGADSAPDAGTDSSAASDGSSEASMTSVVDGSPGPTPSTSPGSGVGMNVGGCTDFDKNRFFADAMRTSREWQLPSGALANHDALGWPQQDASIYVWDGIDRMNGTYHLSFLGQGNVTVSAGTLGAISYDPASNTSSADLVITDAGRSTMLLTFTNTRNTANAGLGTGVTNVKLMKPTTQGGAVPSAASAIWTDVFKTAVASTGAEVLRTLDFTAANSNPQTDWTDRVTPNYASQQVFSGRFFATNSYAKGCSWELVARMANDLGKDIWINVPYMATDD